MTTNPTQPPATGETTTSSVQLTGWGLNPVTSELEHFTVECNGERIIAAKMGGKWKAGPWKTIEEIAAEHAARPAAADEKIIVDGRECRFRYTDEYGHGDPQGWYITDPSVTYELRRDGKWHRGFDPKCKPWPTCEDAVEFARKHADAPAPAKTTRAREQFREWLDEKAPDHDWPQPTTAIAAMAEQFFAPSADGRELKELASMTHGCKACGEERPARIVAGRLTCPECGSENIVCID